MKGSKSSMMGKYLLEICFLGLSVGRPFLSAADCDDCRAGGLSGEGDISWGLSSDLLRKSYRLT